MDADAAAGTDPKNASAAEGPDPRAALAEHAVTSACPCVGAADAVDAVAAPEAAIVDTACALDTRAATVAAGIETTRALDSRRGVIATGACDADAGADASADDAIAIPGPALAKNAGPIGGASASDALASPSRDADDAVAVRHTASA